MTDNTSAKDLFFKMGQSLGDNMFNKLNIDKSDNPSLMLMDLLLAMNDLLASPKGVVPESAEKFYNSRTGKFEF